MFSLNPINLVSQVALAAVTGGTSVMLQAAMRAVISAVGQQIIQQLGEKLGLPQSMIDTAQSALCQSCGDTVGARQNLREAIAGYGQITGQSNYEQGQMEGSLNSQIGKLVEDMAQRITRGSDEDNKQSAGISSTNAKGSVLMKIALAIGNSLDKKLDRMAAITDQIKDLGEVKGKTMSQYQTLSAEMTALGQEVRIISEALNNALKSIGESASKLAGRQ